MANGDPLAGLKDFQRRTVEYVFRRLYLDPEPTRRFLVADEAGLGKTMVARGIIARTVRHLQAKGTPRIDIVYVCSNADIARQNVERLNTSGQPAFVEASRLTLLPLHVARLDEHPLNFISFTPGTTFSLGQRTGTKEERRLLYHLLLPLADISAKGLARLLQGFAGPTWFETIKQPLMMTVDAAITAKFRQALLAADADYAQLRAACTLRHDGRRSLDAKQQEQGWTIIGKLRQRLAYCCLDVLEPDLVILDEFQRFKDLLREPSTMSDAKEKDAAELAQALFHCSSDPRVLLLSATPYKLYTPNGDTENHYEDFLQTVAFLLDDCQALATLTADLKAFRHGLLGLDGEDTASLFTVRSRIEACLRRVMCRTERVGATARGDAMVCARTPPLPLAPKELIDLRLIDAVSRTVGDRDMLEFWESSPYLLNFMKGYNLKGKVQSCLSEGGAPAAELRELLRRHPRGLLRKSWLEKYAPLEPSNARLRLLLQETLDSGLWRLLWLPPSLPYWRPEGPFAHVSNATKVLIFSSWRVVPDAISALVSYAVEQHIVAQSNQECTYAEFPDAFRSILRLSGDPSQPALASRNHSSHMVLALFFPSAALATLVDPLEVACTAGTCPTWADVRAAAAQRLRERLRPLLGPQAPGTAVDKDWYWRAIILLERALDPTGREWCARKWPWGKKDDEGVVFERFRQSWLRTWDNAEQCTGRPPDDLCEVLATLALAGPGVCALRALRRIAPDMAAAQNTLRTAAAHVAEGLLTLFNTPQARAFLEGRSTRTAYWRRVLTSSAQGNLQALLDEQVHVLRETCGLFDASAETRVQRIAEEIQTALSIRTSTLRPDDIHVRTRGTKTEDIPIRCHYALRFGDLRDAENNVSRKEVVRTAFNSPFWPFVLASTSVGQEGLDFHVWCHSLTHWNLPANPVDLEQREGRVQRYKGLAVRRNIAATFGLKALAGRWHPGDDPWRILFEVARANRSADDSDLVPYWIYETENGAMVERRILAAPFSRNAGRYHRLQQGLARYRLVFGQPRQEDLLECLAGRISEEEAATRVSRLRIRLEPTGTPPKK